MTRAFMLGALFTLVIGCKSAAKTDAPDAKPAPCTMNGGCDEGAYCSYQPALCGKGKSPGSCKPRACTDKTYAPVCGCDGVVYDSECQAHEKGVDLAVYGGCKAQVKDWIACGPRFCDARVAYCEIVLSDVFELPSDYACRPLPAACMPQAGVARGCDCFPQGTRCLSFCGPLESAGISGFHLTCRL